MKLKAKQLLLNITAPKRMVSGAAVKAGVTPVEPDKMGFDSPENEWKFPKKSNYNWKGRKKWRRYTYNGEPHPDAVQD